MTVRVSPFLAALALSLAASVALAQEVIPGRDTGAPPSARPTAGPPAQLGDPDQSPEAIGAWANRVLAGKPSQEPGDDPRLAANGARPSGCTPPPDKKPHGEVWAGAGTGGYREAGGVVTVPIGDCAHVTLGYDQTQFNGWRRR